MTDTGRIDPTLLRTGFVLVLGTVMVGLDATIVAVGIRTLADEFAATPAEIQWVTTAYLLAVVAAVPTSGWLVDRIGGRRTWICAMVAFLAASALCALAWSLVFLVIARVLQGLAGGLLPPTGQAVLARTAGPQRIGRVISVVAVVPLLSPVFGPIVGGSLLAVADWPWLFLINLPIGAVAVTLALRVVPADRPSGGRVAFDVVGALLLSPGLAVLVLGLTELGQGRATAAAVLAVAAGTAMVGAFVVHGLRRRATPPLIDPRLLARPPFGSGAVALLALGASVFGAVFLLPLYLQTGRGLSVVETGLLLVPQGVGAALGTVVVNRVIDRMAPRTLVSTGIALIALGTVVFTRLPDQPPGWLVAASLLVRGVGAAAVSSPVLAMVYRTLPGPEIPRAAGALNLLGPVGGAMGTAVFAVVLQDRLTDRALDAAFADTFVWVLVLCVASGAAALRLPGRRPG